MWLCLYVHNHDIDTNMDRRKHNTIVKGSNDPYKQVMKNEAVQCVALSVVDDGEGGSKWKNGFVTREVSGLTYRGLAFRIRGQECFRDGRWTDRRLSSTWGLVVPVTLLMELAISETVYCSM